MGVDQETVAENVDTFRPDVIASMPDPTKALSWPQLRTALLATGRHGAVRFAAHR